MPFRSDVTVDWTLSPRIITVAAPSVEIQVQDLLDTLRVLEAAATNMDDDAIVEASGKERLSAGVQVALTVRLLNAQLAFEARPGPAWVLCTIAGGNLVASDADGDDMDPRFPTAYVTVDRVSSTSGALLDPDISGEGVAAEVWDGTEIEAGVTARQALQMQMAVVAGKDQVTPDGAGGYRVAYRNPPDTKDRVTVDVSEAGQRTAVVYDKS